MTLGLYHDISAQMNKLINNEKCQFADYNIPPGSPLTRIDFNPSMDN